MNPEHPASHPPGLSPGSNLAGIIEVLDYVIAAQLIEKLRDDARSLAPSAVRVEILDRVVKSRYPCSGLAPVPV